MVSLLPSPPNVLLSTAPLSSGAELVPLLQYLVLVVLFSEEKLILSLMIQNFFQVEPPQV